MKKQVTEKQAAKKLVEKLVRKTRFALAEAKKTKWQFQQVIKDLTGLDPGESKDVVDRHLRKVKTEIIKDILDREPSGEQLISLGKYEILIFNLYVAETNLKSFSDNLARVLVQEHQIVNAALSDDVYERAERAILAARKYLEKSR